MFTEMVKRAVEGKAKQTKQKRGSFACKLPTLFGIT